jgi:branched-subunit amino acid ABC-type transport system permease component
MNIKAAMKFARKVIGTVLYSALCILASIGLLFIFGVIVLVDFGKRCVDEATK